MQVCTSLQTDNHANTPPLSFLQAGCPSCRPTNSVKALKDYDVPHTTVFTVKRTRLKQSQEQSVKTNTSVKPLEKMKYKMHKLQVY